MVLLQSSTSQNYLENLLKHRFLFLPQKSCPTSLGWSPKMCPSSSLCVMLLWSICELCFRQQWTWAEWGKTPGSLGQEAGWFYSHNFLGFLHHSAEKHNSSSDQKYRENPDEDENFKEGRASSTKCSSTGGFKCLLDEAVKTLLMGFIKTVSTGSKHRRLPSEE